MRRHSEKRDRRAGHSRQKVVAGRKHLYSPGQSRGQRVRLFPETSEAAGDLMGSVALIRLVVDSDPPSASIADQVAAIARKNLAPMAAAIDAGTVYPAEMLHRPRDVGAW